MDHYNWQSEKFKEWGIIFTEKERQRYHFSRIVELEAKEYFAANGRWPAGYQPPQKRGPTKTIVPQFSETSQGGARQIVYVQQDGESQSWMQGEVMQQRDGAGMVLSETGVWTNNGAPVSR